MLNILIIIFSLGSFAYPSSGQVECSYVENIKEANLPPFSFAFDKMPEFSAEYYKKLAQVETTKNKHSYRVSHSLGLCGYRTWDERPRDESNYKPQDGLCGRDIPEKHTSSERKFLVIYYGTDDVYLCDNSNKIKFCDKKGDKLKVVQSNRIFPARESGYKHSKEVDYVEEVHVRPFKPIKQDYLSDAANYMGFSLSACGIYQYEASEATHDQEDILLTERLKKEMNDYSPNFFNKYINHGMLSWQMQYVINVEDIVFKKQHGNLFVFIDVNLVDATINNKMADAIFTAQVDCRTEKCKEQAIEQAVNKGMPALLEQANNAVGEWKTLGAPYKIYFKGIESYADLLRIKELLSTDPSKYEDLHYEFLEPDLVVFEFRSKRCDYNDFTDYVDSIMGTERSKVMMGHMEFFVIQHPLLLNAITGI